MNIDRQRAESLSTSSQLDRSSRWKPGIWVFRDENGKEFLIKDVKRTAALFRFTFGRWSLRREKKIYRYLEGLPRIPQFLGRLDADALIFERLDAQPLKRDVCSRIKPEFFQQLENWIEELHRRGVVHLDLRQRRNILVGPSGELYIVDFGAAIYLGKNAFSQKVFLPLFAWIDRSAITKFRVRYFPQWASEKEQKSHQRMHWIRRFWVFSPHKKR